MVLILGIMEPVKIEVAVMLDDSNACVAVQKLYLSNSFVKSTLSLPKSPKT
jgi:hypothetical protein